MFRSIYSKLILGFFITIIFSFSVSYYISTKTSGEQIRKLNQNQLVERCKYVKDILSVKDESTKEQLLKNYAISNDLDISIIIDDKLSNYGYNNYNKKDDVINFHESIEEKVIVTKDTIFSYHMKAIINGKLHYIYVEQDNTIENSIFANYAVLILGIVFLVGSIVFFIIADIIVKPITKLTKMTQELSKGNYNVRVNYAGDDEISKLNQGFNQMAVKLTKQDETRQKFISDVSHEFQTPLTSIQGFANILKEENLPVSQRKKYADIILFNSKRLSTLAKNMLQLTMLERDEIALELSSYSLINQLNRVISGECYAADEKNIEIVFDVPKKDILINADESRMEQVWTNILSNSIKYTNQDGLITISVKRNIREIEVSIEDTGIGMSKESVSHIFERFYREDKARNREGNGLGLSIVKSILDLHGAKIDVISQVDVGTTFIVKIPVENLNIMNHLNLR